MPVIFRGGKNFSTDWQLLTLKKTGCNILFSALTLTVGHTPTGSARSNYRRVFRQLGRHLWQNLNYTTTGDRFKELLRRAYERTGQRAVVLIDEYDKPILDVLDTGTYTCNHVGEKLLLEDHHREILKSFYSTFKGADEYLKFVLLTGVTKFSQVSCVQWLQPTKRH